MFKIFKEKKLKKQFEQINFNKPFDLQYNENYQLDSKETSHFAINSYIFNAHSFEKRQSIYIKLSTYIDQTEACIYYIEGHNKYVLEQQWYTNTCPLKINKDVDGINITFSGYLKKNNKDNAKLTFQGKFESNNEIIDKWSNFTKEKIFDIFKREKDYMQKIEKMEKTNNVSYNQLGSLKGRMILEGQNSLFDFSCIRQHEFGIYDYSQVNNHLSIIIADKEKQLNFDLISEPNMSLCEIGNYKQKDQINYITKAVYERQLLSKGTSPTYLNILLQLDNGKELGLHIKKIDEFEIEYQEQYNVYISVIEVLMEGKKYRGHMECGFNKNPKHWFNGIDISNYKNEK